MTELNPIPIQAFDGFNGLFIKDAIVKSVVLPLFFALISTMFTLMESHVINNIQFSMLKIKNEIKFFILY